MNWMIWKLVSLERFWLLTDHCWDSNIQWLLQKKGWHCYNVRPPRYLSWFITPITMVYGRQITIVTGAYKPTYNWGASHCNICLVGGIPTPLKNDGVKVSWDHEIPNIWKNEKCSKPPTKWWWTRKPKNWRKKQSGSTVQPSKRVISLKHMVIQASKNGTIWLWLTVCHGKSPPMLLIGEPL